MYEFPKNPRASQSGQNRGIDDHSIYCFFKLNLQPGTLKQDLTDKQCSFLVNLMTDNNSTKVSYEQYLDFIIPRTKKRITQSLVNKIRQTEPVLNKGRNESVNYDAVCVLGKLFECEI